VAARQTYGRFLFEADPYGAELREADDGLPLADPDAPVPVVLAERRGDQHPAAREYALVGKLPVVDL
jgi:hypothetical protein